MHFTTNMHHIRFPLYLPQQTKLLAQIKTKEKGYEASLLIRTVLGKRSGRGQCDPPSAGCSRSSSSSKVKPYLKLAITSGALRAISGTRAVGAG